MAGNGWQLLEIAGMAGHVWKWLDMAEKGWNWLEWPGIGWNGLEYANNMLK